jgi:hypothetical protein
VVAKFMKAHCANEVRKARKRMHADMADMETHHRQLLDYVLSDLDTATSRWQRYCRKKQRALDLDCSD